MIREHRHHQLVHPIAALAGTRRKARRSWFVCLGQRIIGWLRPFCRSSLQVRRSQERYPSHVCDSDSFSPSCKSDVDEKRDDNNLGTIVIFRAVQNLRYHYTKNLEKGGRGEANWERLKDAAAQVQRCQNVSAPQRGVWLKLVIKIFLLWILCDTIIVRYIRTDTYKIHDDLRCTRAMLLNIDSYRLAIC